MPFDPSYPAHGVRLVSAEMRTQFNALHDEITTIPQGPVGPVGPSGENGAPGPQGEPGEVTAAQLGEAVAGALVAAANDSSANSNGVPTLDTPFADPDLESMRLGFNALVLALRR
jgi:hypothetical protein